MIVGLTLDFGCAQAFLWLFCGRHPIVWEKQQNLVLPVDTDKRANVGNWTQPTTTGEEPSTVDFLHIVDQINFLIEHSAAQWWVIPLVSLFCLIDGFFLFLPSETAIVALASISARTGDPNVWLLIIGATIGAMLGDNVAYFMGRTFGTTRFKWMRKPRGAAVFAWAGKELEKRGAILIFTARYIPVGRIAVNFTAGATHFPWRRFLVLDGIAVVTWASYSVAVGTFAGRWVHHNPLLGVGIAIAFAIAIGFIVDHAIKYLHHFLEKRGKVAPRLEPGLMAAQHAAQVQAEQAQIAAARLTQARHAAEGARLNGTGVESGTDPSVDRDEGSEIQPDAETEDTTGEDPEGAGPASGAPVANVPTVLGGVCAAENSRVFPATAAKKQHPVLPPVSEKARIAGTTSQHS